jgi:hypothetical protein
MPTPGVVDNHSQLVAADGIRMKKEVFLAL